jgi:hypothetical protein
MPEPLVLNFGNGAAAQDHDDLDSGARELTVTHILVAVTASGYCQM